MALKRLTINDPYDIGKIPPQAIDMEEAVLGALLLESETFITICDILNPGCFYKDEHQKIYSSILELFDKNKPIDLLTVTEQLRTNKELEAIGGVAYISKLTSNIASASHIEYHARIIKQKFIQREMILISSEVQNRAYDESIDVLDLIEFAESELFNIQNESIKKDIQTIGQIGAKEIKVLEKISKNEIDFTGVPSGFTSLDRITGGWQKTDLVILAARPSMGKSIFALRMAKNIADLNMNVALFSLEMGCEQLWRRLISGETDIENGKLRNAKFTDFEWNRIEKAQGKLEKLGIHVDDTPGLSITDLKAKCRKLKLKKNIDIIIIDYLQLMQGFKEKNSNREQEISSISRNLKVLAKELNVPVICLSQLNRSVETRGGDKKPQLSDLRESGAIEQDADIVAFINRPEYYNIYQYDDGESTHNVVELLIKKHRNGALADLQFLRNDHFSLIFERQNKVETQIF